MKREVCVEKERSWELKPHMSSSPPGNSPGICRDIYIQQQQKNWISTKEEVDILLSWNLLNRKQNLHVQTTPPTPNHQLSSIRLAIQILLGHQEPALVAASTRARPAHFVGVVGLGLRREVFQVDGLQPGVEDFLGGVVGLGAVWVF